MRWKANRHTTRMFETGRCAIYKQGRQINLQFLNEHRVATVEIQDPSLTSLIMFIDDPCEMMLGFHQPSRSLFSSLPTELSAVRPRYRSKVYLVVDKKTEESQSKTEDEFNEDCIACSQRKEKNLAKEKTKNVEKEATNAEIKVNTNSQSKAEKHITVRPPEKNDDKKFEIRLNVNGFEPENIQVKVKGRSVEIEAQSENKDDSNGRHSFRRLHRKYTLPEHVNPDYVTSFLNKDGYLSIEAPQQAPQQLTTEASLQDHTTPSKEDNSSTEENTGS